MKTCFLSASALLCGTLMLAQTNLSNVNQAGVSNIVDVTQTGSKNQSDVDQTGTLNPLE